MTAVETDTTETAETHSATTPAGGPPDPGGERKVFFGARRRDPPAARQVAITLSDLLEDVTWRVLARAVPMSLRPERLGLALVTVILIGIVCVGLLPLTLQIGSRYGAALTGLASDLEAGALLQIGVWLDAMVLEIPTDLLRDWGVLLIGLLAWSAVVLTLSGIGAARSAGLEAGPERRLPFVKSVAFAARHAASGVGGAVALSAGAVAMLSVTTLLGLVPVGEGLVGTLVYTGLGIVSLLAVTLSVLALLGGILLAPAIACDGDGAIDAAQRAPAYVVQRPGTLFGLLALAIAQGAIFLGVLLLLRLVSLRVAGWAAGIESDADAARTWAILSGVLVVGVALSYVQVASTLIYMLMRQACDGQPLSVIWRAGEVAGVFTLDPDHPQPEADAADD